MIFDDVTAQRIRLFHDTCLATLGWASSSAAEFASRMWGYIELNHRYNCLLWAEEDLARRRDVADSEIAANKRH